MIKMENGDIICNRGASVFLEISLETEDGDIYELEENEKLVVTIYNSDNVKTAFECADGATTIDSKTTNLLTGCYYFTIAIVNTDTGDINGVYPPHRIIIVD